MFPHLFQCKTNTLGCRPNQSETESEPGSSVVVSTPSGPTQVGMRNEDDRGEDQVEVMPVSDTEQDDERQPLKRYATDRGHYDVGCLSWLRSGLS